METESPGSLMLPRAGFLFFYLNLFIPDAVDCMSAQPGTFSFWTTELCYGKLSNIMSVKFAGVTVVVPESGLI